MILIASTLQYIYIKCIGVVGNPFFLSCPILKWGGCWSTYFLCIKTHVGTHVVQSISLECLFCLELQTTINIDFQGQKVKGHQLNYTCTWCSSVTCLYHLSEGNWHVSLHLSSISCFSQFQNDVNITDANFYANITEKNLAEILKSDSVTPIPLLEERVAVLREAGKVLLEVSEKSKFDI